MTEDWPTRPDGRLFYAAEKAQLERLLRDEAAKHRSVQPYVLRPPIVVGPHSVGAKAEVPFLPPTAEWVQAFSRPAIMDTGKAKEVLGWRPRYTAAEALRTMLS